jgi:hypothetical protein
MHPLDRLPTRMACPPDRLPSKRAIHMAVHLANGPSMLAVGRFTGGDKIKFTLADIHPRPDNVYTT